MTNQDIPLRQPLRREDQRQSQGREQSFWHHRNDDADRKNEVLPERHLDCRADSEEDQSDTDRRERRSSGSNRRAAGAMAKPRRRWPGSRLRDPAEFGARAGREHDSLALSGNDRRAGQQNIAAADNIVFLRRVWIASLGHRFTGHGGIVDPKAECLDQATVCALRCHLVRAERRRRAQLLDC